MAYGYLRAFDEFIHRERPEDYLDCLQTTEAIKQKRTEIYDREDEILRGFLTAARPYRYSPMARLPHTPAGICPLSIDELNELRTLKRDLFQLVYDRFSRYGASSLPKWFGTPGHNRSERIFDWWEYWEHIEPRSTPSNSTEYFFYDMSLPGRPFDRQSVWDPNTRTEALEPSEPQGPIISQDFRLAMAF
jgi:hypothetical protein